MYSQSFCPVINDTKRKLVELGLQKASSAAAILNIINDVAGKAQYL